MAAVMALCREFNCSPFELRRLPLRWVEGALLILRARRELEELAEQRLRRGR